MGVVERDQDGAVDGEVREPLPTTTRSTGRTGRRAAECLEPRGHRGPALVTHPGRRRRATRRRVPRRRDQRGFPTPASPSTTTIRPSGAPASRLAAISARGSSRYDGGPDGRRRGWSSAPGRRAGAGRPRAAPPPGPRPASRAGDAARPGRPRSPPAAAGVVHARTSNACHTSASGGSATSGVTASTASIPPPPPPPRPRAARGSGSRRRGRAGPPRARAPGRGAGCQTGPGRPAPVVQRLVGRRDGVGSGAATQCPRRGGNARGRRRPGRHAGACPPLETSVPRNAEPVPQPGHPRVRRVAAGFWGIASLAQIKRASGCGLTNG